MWPEGFKVQQPQALHFKPFGLLEFVILASLETCSNTL